MIKKIAVILFLITVVLLSAVSVLARESFNLGPGNKINIMSDKAYRISSTDSYEAVGNVVITLEDKSLYGEKASLSMLTGDVFVIGNVRYVSAIATVYGSQIFYNIKNNKMEITNGRILSDNYVVLGKHLAKIDEINYFGREAEYTTCKDCPESWSIFGKEVQITMNEYIRITHAYFKINGVIIMYIPYIILPIKKDRESGLLFPNISTNNSNGMVFQQPWFWNLSRHNDMTITPSAFVNRGLGMEWQYRQVLGDRKWFEINSLQLSDSIYLPDVDNTKTSGKDTFRHFSDYEHHFSFGNNFVHHFYFNDVSDLDMVRDFSFFSASKIRGSELGGGGFFDYRTSILNLSFESYFNRNQLVKHSEEFDSKYVQMLPKISLSVEPFSLISSRYFGLHKISAFINGDFTNFRQDHAEENEDIRNAQRLNLKPTLNWYLGHVGPIDMKTMATFDYQKYFFPEELENKYFTKSAILYETEFSVEFEKIFGIALSEDVSSDSLITGETESEVAVSNAKEVESNSSIIGALPAEMNQYVNRSVTITSNSYKHIQEYKLKHYFLSDTQMYGNEKFKNQITEETTLDGLFDNIDSIKTKVFRSSAIDYGQELPFSNTFELQWNNSIVKKTPQRFNPSEDGKFLTNNFIYSRMAYFNLSQGYVFNVDSQKWKDKLTRLKIDTGIAVLNKNINISEYYYYNNTHLFTLHLIQNFSAGNIDFNFKYNSTEKYKAGNKYEKLFGVGGALIPVDVLKISYLYNYDIYNRKNTEKILAFTYSPYNNCWKLEVRRKTTLEDSTTSINFLINYNNNSFHSLIN